MMSELASLNKLSPSRMADIRLGTFTNFIMVAADTASGGETMPPNKKPKATEKPGIKVLAINPNNKGRDKHHNKGKRTYYPAPSPQFFPRVVIRRFVQYRRQKNKEYQVGIDIETGHSGNEAHCHTTQYKHNGIGHFYALTHHNQYTNGQNERNDQD